MTDLPPSPSPVPYQPVDSSQSNLNTLSIFYFILAGLQALGACLFVLYVILGVLFAAGGIAGSRNGSDAGAAVGIGSMFVCFGLFFVAFIGLFAYLNFLAGKSLRQRRRISLIYVMAAIACLNIPLGTILGIFTFVVLSKPEVKATFT